MSNNRIQRNEYFGAGQPPVFVTSNKHHGKVGLHNHEFYELVYIERGLALHSHEGHTQILTTGDVFIILPGEVHAYISANNTSLYNCLFTSEALVGHEGEIGELQGLSGMLQGQKDFHRVHAGPAESRELLIDLEKMMWERLNKAAGWELKVKSLLYGLLVTYSRLYGNSRLTIEGAHPNIMHILSAVTFIEDHYTQDILVEDVAAAAGLSPGYLSRQFKALLDATPSEYARHFRMAKAAELLRIEKNTVTQVAEMLGFSDVSLFSRQFRQVTGITPTGFRKNE